MAKLEQSSRPREAIIQEGSAELRGALALPEQPKGVVVVALGGGIRQSGAWNREIAPALASAGLATLQFELLTAAEGANRGNYFDIPRLGHRLTLATDWLRGQEGLAERLPIGYLAAGTAGGAALWAAAEQGDGIAAVVCLNGRPDLATSRLREVSSPVLLLCGDLDEYEEEMNRQAVIELCNARLKVLPEASPLFDEPGAREASTSEAARWFLEHFSRRKQRVAA